MTVTAAASPFDDCSTTSTAAKQTSHETAFTAFLSVKYSNVVDSNIAVFSESANTDNQISASNCVNFCIN